MSLEKLSVAELKGRLKNIGMVQTGEKGTLIFRLNLFDKCNVKNIRSMNEEGLSVNPCQLKFGELKKIAAKEGVSPIGTQDEILAEFVKVLENKSLVSSANSGLGEKTDKISPAGVAPDAVAIARRILQLDEIDDYEGILNIGNNDPSNPIIKTSSIGVMRKAYLKLSLLIHPDKLGRQFDNATRAFQALVRAFDTLSSPDMTAEEDTAHSRGKTNRPEKQFTIARSNDGCYRTRIRCPRCRTPWNEGTLDGNPVYTYNFIMMGLKCYTCSTCLCEFGCMTAFHNCPFCHKSFEYSIADYHRKITCANKACGKPFGFFMFPTSDRVLKELKVELKEEQERRIKLRENKLRRNAAASRRAIQQGSTDYEAALVIGLIDCCPRCGESLDELPDEEERRLHLMQCQDVAKHAAHAAKESKKREIEQAKLKQAQQQESAQTLAAWTFLGAKESQLWLLDDEHVRHKAIAMGIDAAGTKDDMIAKIASKSQSSDNSKDVVVLDDSEDDVAVQPSQSKRKASQLQRIKNENSLATSVDRKGNSSAVVAAATTNTLVVRKKRKLSIDALPNNWHSLPTAQLRSVCASNGLLGMISPQATKDDIIAVLEEALFDD